MALRGPCTADILPTAPPALIPRAGPLGSSLCPQAPRAPHTAPSSASCPRPGQLLTNLHPAGRGAAPARDQPGRHSGERPTRSFWTRLCLGQPDPHAAPEPALQQAGGESGGPQALPQARCTDLSSAPATPARTRPMVPPDPTRLQFPAAAWRLPWQQGRVPGLPAARPILCTRLGLATRLGQLPARGLVAAGRRSRRWSRACEHRVSGTRWPGRCCPIRPTDPGP